MGSPVPSPSRRAPPSRRSRRPRPGRHAAGGRRQRRRRRRLAADAAEPRHRADRAASAATTRCRRWPPPACIPPTCTAPDRPRRTTTPACGRRQTTPSSTAILFGHAAGIDVQRLSASTNLVAQLATAYNQRDSRARSPAAPPTSPRSARSRSPAWARRPAVLAQVNAYLRGQQHIDGGWNFGRVTTDAQRAAAGSADMTGAVLAALCETGAAANDPDVRAGLSFLEGRQDPATGALRERRLDRLGAVRPPRVRRRPAGRPLHHLREPHAGGLPALPAGAERGVPLRRRAQPLLDAERGAGAGRRGVLGRPAAARDRRRPALPRRRRPSPTARRRRTCWRSRTARETCACAA